MAAENGQEAEKLAVPANIKFKDLVLCVDCHPSLPIIASGSIDGHVAIHSYSGTKNECQRQLHHHKKSCRSVKFSPSGKRLYTVGKDKSLWCIDVETGCIRRKIKPAHKVPVNSLVVTGERYVATGDDDGAVKLWDMRSKNCTMELKECQDYISDMIIDDNAKLLLATSGEGTLTAFNIRRKKVDLQSELYDSELLSLCAVKNQQKLVVGSGDGTLYLFNWGEWGNMSDRFPGHPASVSCMVAINNDIVCTGCSDGRIRAVNILPNRFLGVVGEHRFDVERLALSHDGQLVVSCSHDQCVKFWDITDAERQKVNTKKKAQQSSKIKKLGKGKQEDFFSGLEERSTQEEDEDSDDDSDEGSDSDSSDTDSE